MNTTRHIAIKETLNIPCTMQPAGARVACGARAFVVLVEEIETTLLVIGAHCKNCEPAAENSGKDFQAA